MLRIFKKKKLDRSDALLLNTFGMLGCATDVRSDVRRSEDSAWSNIPGSRAKIFTNVREALGGCRRKRRKQEKEEEDSPGGVWGAFTHRPSGESPPFYFHLSHLSLLFPSYNRIPIRGHDYSSCVPIFSIACAILFRRRDWIIFDVKRGKHRPSFVDRSFSEKFNYVENTGLYFRRFMGITLSHGKKGC